MKLRITVVFLCVLLTLAILPVSASAQKNTDEIIILYENDTHCVIEGYTKLSAMKKELEKTHDHVGVVCGGDFIRGNSLGMISEGEYIVNIMNIVGYDAVTVGNHEFGYGIDRLDELVGLMDTKPICCNFRSVGEEETYFEPYSIISYGDTDVAFIGILTPTTITLGANAKFKDDNDVPLYTFEAAELYDVVQKNIDAAKAEGADHIIALSHIGYYDDEPSAKNFDIVTLIENTEGFDVVLDAHSHSVIEGMTVLDKSGNEVLLTSAGTKFEYFGKLTISNDGYSSELIRTEDYPLTDPVTDAYIEQVYNEYEKLGERKIGETKADLIIQDENGNRLVRITDTNLGYLCAESFRTAVDADISYVNGGNIRSDIPAGDITFNDLLSTFPFNNAVVKAEIDGQTLKDLLEMAVKDWPAENGTFPHMAGLTFSLNTAIDTSVVLNEDAEFVGVDGPYRVYNIKVLDHDSGEYKPLDLDAVYTIAANDYSLVGRGGGLKMFDNAVILQNNGILDIEAVERYITEDLGGIVGEEYLDFTSAITFTDGEIYPDDGTDVPNGSDVMKEIIDIAAGCIAILMLLVS